MPEQNDAVEVVEEVASSAAKGIGKYIAPLITALLVGGTAVTSQVDSFNGWYCKNQVAVASSNAIVIQTMYLNAYHSTLACYTTMVDMMQIDDSHCNMIHDEQLNAVGDYVTKVQAEK